MFGTEVVLRNTHLDKAGKNSGSREQVLASLFLHVLAAVKIRTVRILCSVLPPQCMHVFVPLLINNFA